MKAKVYGAGSIGNHLSNASRRLGWDVDVVDTDPAALERMRTQIYPTRYGAWDDSIGLFTPDRAPVGGYDLICIGTPPDAHVPLARQAVTEGARAVLIEKPIATPDLKGLDELWGEAAAAGVRCFVGYDHVVGRASVAAGDVLSAGRIGKLVTLDVEFREEWSGIFAAHPWLSGPADSYLAYWQRGGGASGEHSHALNLWQHFSHLSGNGRVIEVSAVLDFVNDGTVDYDRLALVHLTTESGLVGRCVQDVVTKPPRKWARLQGNAGHVEWWAGREPGVDILAGIDRSSAPIESRITKTRPDDFIEELRHIADCIQSGMAVSPISLERGLETMLVIAAAHLSNSTKRRVRIDYSKGWGPTCLEVVN